MKNVSPSPIILVEHESFLVNAVAEAIQFEESKNGHKPSRILDYANITIDEKFNNWQLLNSAVRNDQLCIREIAIIECEKEVKFQIHELEELLLTLEKHPPIKPSYPPLDWSHCFLAQLGMAAETQGLSPEELLKIFCIRLDMSYENNWRSFKWRENLELDYFPLSVRREVQDAGLQ